MKFYGYYRSSASYRVRIALNLKGVEYDYQRVHLLKNGGQQREQAYQDINPQQLVPSLVLDSGEVLNQSLAIIEYLDETYPKPPLLPTEPIHRAFCRKIAHAVAMDMQPYCNLRTLQYLTGTLSLDNAIKIQWLQDWMHKGFIALETWVSQGHYSGPFIGGSQVTLADVCLVPQLFTARRFDVSLEAYPELLKVEAACQELDAFFKAKPDQQPDFEQ